MLNYVGSVFILLDGQGCFRWAPGGAGTNFVPAGVSGPRQISRRDEHPPGEKKGPGQNVEERDKKIAVKRWGGASLLAGSTWAPPLAKLFD